MEEVELRDIVRAASFEEDGGMKLACATAFELAAKHGVALLDIAGVCNRENIRFCNCQLGCFK